jgi:MFS family permease
MGAIFGSIASGLSSGLFGLSLGQPSFYESLSLSADPTSPSYSHTTSIIGASTGVWFAGGFFGSLMTGPLSERIGRIRGFQVAAICHIIGGILQAASVNQAMVVFPRTHTLRRNVLICYGNRSTWSPASLPVSPLARHSLL